MTKISKDIYVGDTGKTLNDIATKHMITAYLNESYSLTQTGEYDILPLVQYIKLGTKLTMRNDGGIQIGAGVKYVKVNANMSWNSLASENAKWCTIYKSTLAAYPSPTITSVRTAINNTGGLISVVQGDVIYLKAQGTKNDVVRGQSSNLYTALTVEVIE